MKEIKTKPEGGKPRLLESAAKAPKTAMKDVWLKSKEKAVSELKGTPFASQQGETSNAPANSAGDQMLSSIETTAKKGADLTYRGGKKLAQTTARKVKEKREISRTLSEAKNAGGKTVEITKDAASKIRTKNPAAKAVKGKPQKAVKTASRSMKGVKNSAKGIKTAQRSAKTAQQTAKAAAKASQKAAQAARTAARATVTGVKAAARVTVAAVKAGSCGDHFADLFDRPDRRFLLRAVLRFGFHGNRHQRNAGGRHPQPGIYGAHSGNREYHRPRPAGDHL